ncbi:hypothetical protein BS78_08G105900 [Paspalum vaginatum]|nr:hypothetical protein BS78_08G105900 [Paspalum vaginatum]
MAKHQKIAAALRSASLITVSVVCLAAASSTAASSSPPVCAGSYEPIIMLGAPLGLFCGGGGGGGAEGGGMITCCDAGEDEAVRARFEAMRISDANCAAIVKAFLCAKCVPSLSAALFNTVDLTTAAELSVPLLCGSTLSSTSGWQQPPTARLPQEQDATLCLEKISMGSYVTMAAHPDSSDQVFMSSQDGKIWQASMPEQGSRVAMRVTDHLFLDLTHRVHYDAAHGLMGVAFHPEFATNGRFFVSYNCDSNTSPDCGAGRCWGVGVSATNGSRPCRYQLIVAEFSAEGGHADYSKATRANPSEVRRIFTMGLPQPQKSYSYQQHGGQILFRPGNSDEYLYLITGHGDFSKSGRSLLAKIIRFDVGGGMPGESRQKRIHGTPKPEIFAMGLNNPSGCTFDSQRPSYLYCADVSEQQYERVYVTTKGGGQHGDSLSKSAVSRVVINHGRPAEGRMPSIVGGLLYRGSADPFLKGRYVHIHASTVWTSLESNGSYYASAQVPNVRCSRSSPLPCHGNGIVGIAGRVLSLGEDSSKDAFVLATAGVFRAVQPGLLGWAGCCSWGHWLCCSPTTWSAAAPRYCVAATE